MAIFTNSPVCGAHPSRFCRSTILSHFLPSISLIVFDCIRLYPFLSFLSKSMGKIWVKFQHITTSPSPSCPIAQWHTMRRMGPHDLAKASLVGRCWKLMAFYPLVMTNVAIENGHRNSGFAHWKWWFSIAMLNYQRVTGLKSVSSLFVGGNTMKYRFRLVFICIYVTLNPKADCLNVTWNHATQILVLSASYHGGYHQKKCANLKTKKRPLWAVLASNWVSDWIMM